ncbi:MAG: SAM-dependent methyltransferase [Actinomycetota bacterium]
MTLLEEILDEIDREGPISFSRYMELALYHPLLGFYAGGGAGRRRDFITSPEVGPLFGSVVAIAIDRWWDELGCPERFTFVEVGAGPGTLARTVLRSDLRCADALEYVTVESSEAQRSEHPDGVDARHVMPARVECGVIFANELLDNLPFDILSFVDGRGWREVKVGRSADGLVEVLVETDRGPTPSGGADSEIRMPIQTAAADWLASARSSLGTGRVVVIDYAVPSYPVDPGRDWLRTYGDHGRAGDALAGPGTKDITADVDVGRLRAVAPTAAEGSQATWLRRHRLDELVAEGLEYWDAHRAAPDLRAMEMRSRATESEALVDPRGLGAFTVLEWSVDRP